MEHVARALVAVTLSLLLFSGVAVFDLFADGLVPFSARAALGVASGAAFAGAVLFAPLSLALGLTLGPLRRRLGRSPAGFTWALFALLLAALGALWCLAVYSVAPRFPVRRDNLIAYAAGALLIAAPLALVAARRLVRRYGVPRFGPEGVALGFALIAYGFHSWMTRNILFALHMGSAAALYLALLAFSALVLCRALARVGVGRLSGAGAALALVLFGLAAGFPSRFSRSFALRDAMARGSDLARAAAEIVRLTLRGDDTAPDELAARAAPAPKDALAPFPSGGGRELGARLAALRPKNILVITVDALRLDAFLAGDTPTFARLRREGVLVGGYVTAAPSTEHSFFSMFFGAYYPRRERAGESLLEVFQRAGFLTIGVFGTRAYQLETRKKEVPGFDVVDHSPSRRWQDPSTAGLVNDRLLVHLREAGDKRFFAWAHYIDLHLPYDGEGSSDKERYLSEARLIDAALGELFAALEVEGILKDTLVVLSADHGEEIYDHGGRSHSRTLFDEVVRVPLVFWMPGSGLAGRVELPAVGVDLGPTFLALAGVERPASFAPDGVDLFTRRVDEPLITMRGVFSRQVFGLNPEPAAEVAVFWGRFKLIVNLEYDSAALYDLAEDPGERVNLVDERPDIAAACAAELRRWFTE
jgi:hypothetical protein